MRRNTFDNSLAGLLNPRDGFAFVAPLPLRRAAVAVSSYDFPPRFSFSSGFDVNLGFLGTNVSSPSIAALGFFIIFFFSGFSTLAFTTSSSSAAVSSSATTSKSTSS